MLDLIIKNGQCYINGKLENKDVAVKDGKISKIGEVSEEAKEVYDAKNLIVLPGCIDTQTHFREPGSTDTEDLHSGSRAATVSYTHLRAHDTCRRQRQMCIRDSC